MLTGAKCLLVSGVWRWNGVLKSTWKTSCWFRICGCMFGTHNIVFLSYSPTLYSEILFNNVFLFPFNGGLVI